MDQPNDTRQPSPAPEPSRPRTFHQTLARISREHAGRATDLPADLAAEHDHYLHGTAKRPGEPSSDAA